MAEQQQGKPSVLVFAGVFPPAYEATGPARSVAAMVRRLGSEIDFAVVARVNPARPGPQPDVWVDWEGSSVMYVSPGWRARLALARRLPKRSFDVLHLNSMFAVRSTWLPLVMWRLGKIRAQRVVIAPRGEFSPAALNIHGLRKRLALQTLRFLGLLRRVEWHMSTAREAEQLRATMGVRTKVVHIARDMVDLPPVPVRHGAGAHRADGPLRVAFLSRVAPMKNLDGALRALSLTRERVELTIAGPVSDERYWLSCRPLLQALPEHVKVLEGGVIPADDVVGFLASFDLLFLPSHGENFGHVIAESLVAGTPVLISDQTPWSDVEAVGAGWVRTTDDLAGFAEVLDQYASRPAEERLSHRMAARRLAEERFGTDEAERAHRRMFTSPSGGARR